MKIRQPPTNLFLFDILGQPPGSLRYTHILTHTLKHGYPTYTITNNWTRLLLAGAIPRTCLSGRTGGRGKLFVYLPVCHLASGLNIMISARKKMKSKLNWGTRTNFMANSFWVLVDLGGHRSSVGVTRKGWRVDDRRPLAIAMF